MSEHSRGLNAVVAGALLWALVVGPEVRGGEVAPATAAQEERLPWFYDEIVDPSRTEEERAPDLALLTREADEGGRVAASLLGRLYFMGEDHPARPVARDLDRAEHYLQIAMASGDLAAMLWLAEVELARGRALEAAIWVQSYILLRSAADETEDGTGYVPALLARLEDAPGGSAIDRTTLAEYVTGFVYTHGERLRNAAAMDADPRGTGWPKSRNDRNRSECSEVERRSSAQARILSPRRAGRRSEGSGQASFLLEIQPDGVVSDAMLVHSVPDASYGTRVKRVALSMAFNEVPADCPSRWAMAPMSLINSNMRLVQ